MNLRSTVVVLAQKHTNSNNEMGPLLPHESRHMRYTCVNTSSWSSLPTDKHRHESGDRNAGVPKATHREEEREKEMRERGSWEKCKQTQTDWL